MKRILSFVAIVLVAVSFSFAGGGRYEFAQSTGPVLSQYLVVNITDSNVDTLDYVVEPGVASLTLEVTASDTVDAVITVLRKGQFGTQSIQAGDTIMTLAAAPTAAQTKLADVSVTPVPDVYRFIITQGTVGGSTGTISVVIRKKYFFSR